MKRVLVDTSVWVEHFRNGSAHLVDLLLLDLVVTHPFVIGEIACGTPPLRSKTLSDLHQLQPAQQATIQETIAFIERENLSGKGCGLIDLVLLASTLLTPGVELWTQDKRLATLAEHFGVQHLAMPH
ncbi:MAG: hypothetical protein RIR00_1557 [Pseudomonadota bacterium]|jgi:predicted nucleic acid-binding protein